MKTILAFATLAVVAVSNTVAVDSELCRTTLNSCVAQCDKIGAKPSKNICSFEYSACVCSWNAPSTSAGDAFCKAEEDSCSTLCKGFESKTYTCDKTGANTWCQCNPASESLAGKNTTAINEGCKSFFDKCYTDTCKGKTDTKAICINPDSDAKCDCDGNREINDKNSNNAGSTSDAVGAASTGFVLMSSVAALFASVFA